MAGATQSASGRTGWVLLLTSVLLLGVAAMAVTANTWKHDFRVLRVRTQGSRIVPDSDIVRMAAIPMNARLFDVDLNSARLRVQQNPFFRSVSVAREIPDGLAITVTERTPVAALITGRVLCLDGEGYVLGPIRPGRLIDLPVMTGEFSPADCIPGQQVRSRRLREALEILTTAQRIGDDLYRMISEVHCEPDSTFVLFTAESGVPVAFGRGDAAVKLVKFDGFWKQIVTARGAAQLKTVDLRFAGQVVVRWEGEHAGEAQ
ncbi:MAG TPA: FtsQ-type POTRA domain-containing protein [Bacteroidota bacterium]|nr:FtsQ-type POTRA domain-containing protein [Bacteroidota bacterium]